MTETLRRRPVDADRLREGGAPWAGRSGRRPRTRETRLRAVERAIAVMREHFREPLSLDSLADAAVFSPYHFNRFFRQITGLTPGRFLAAVRIHEAKRLLVTSGVSVTGICFEVGYNSPGTFSRQFSEFVGVSPLHFRRWGTGTVPDCFEALRSGLGPLAQPSGAPRLSIRVDRAGCNGPGFIGAFTELVPRGEPVGCAVSMAGEDVDLAITMPGRFHLFAVSIPLSSDPVDVLLCDEAPRGRFGPVIVSNGIASPDRVRLRLRAPAATDPPVLMSLPFRLIERRLEAQAAMA